MRPGLPGELAALACLLVSLAALGLASEHWELVAPFFVLAPLSLALAGRVRVPRLGARASMAAFVPFALAMRFYEVDGTSGLGFVVPFYVSLFLVSLALLKLASPADRGRLSHVLFCSAAAMAACGADVTHRSYLVLVAAFSVPAVVVLRFALPGDEAAPLPAVPGVLRRRAALLVATFVATGALSAGGVVLVDRNYEQVSQALIRRIARTPLSSGGGFSGNARLGSVAGLQGDAGNEVALRVFSKRAPGYLRARCFVSYEKGEWSQAPVVAEARPTKGEGERFGRFVLPGRPRPLDEREADLSVHATSEYARHFFLPLQASAVETSSDLVQAFLGGAVESHFDSTEGGYGVLVDAAPVTSQKADAAFRIVPTDPEVLAAIDAVIPRLRLRDRSPEAVAGAVRNWIAENYEYRFGIQLERGKDPIVRFLTEKREGHCELFATTGALLLRRLGVPARYVTGYLCFEESPSEGVWLSRHKHAHAWVELQDRHGSWQTAEFTPPAGMPEFDKAAGSGALWERLRTEWERLREALARHGALGLLGLAVRGAAAWFFDAWWRAGAVGVFVLALVLRRVRGLRRGARAAARPERVFPEALARERERVLRLEGELRRAGHGRGDAETLDEWADRLARLELPGRDEVVAQVRGYAARRYEPF